MSKAKKTNRESAREEGEDDDEVKAMVQLLPGTEAELIPMLSALEPVYGDGSLLDEARLRFDRLADKFQAVYAARPALFARSSGRVNLIGEHIDYEGYSVLPISIRQDMIVAIRRAEGNEVRIANVDKSTPSASNWQTPTRSNSREGDL